MAIVGDLVTRLTANISGLAAGLGKGQGLIAGFARSAVASLAVVGGGAALAGLAGFAVKAAGSLEQTRVAFETLLGSAGAATDKLAELRQFAAGTPFQFTELVDTTRRLLALGFSAEETTPTLRIVGDAVSALGTGSQGLDRITLALGQMRTKGKLSAQELNQLAEAGVGAADMIAKKMGISVQEVFKLGEAGKIGGKFAASAILEGMQERFAGGMEKQSKTLFGIFSNIQDSVGFIMADIGGAIVEGLNLKAGAKNVADFAASFTTDWLPSISAGIKFVGGWVQWFGGLIYKFFASDVVQSFGEMFVAQFIGMQRLLTSVGSAIGTLITQVLEATGTGEAFGRAWNTATTFVADAFKAIAFGLRNIDLLFWVAIEQVNLFGQNLYARFENAIGNVQTLLGFFRENWFTIFADMGKLALTMLANLGGNFAKFFKATQDFAMGRGFNFEASALTDGFKSGLKDLPKLTEAAIKETSPRLAALYKQIADREASVAANAAGTVTGKDGILGFDVANELAGAAKKTGGADRNGLGAALRGSKEAFSSIFRNMRQANDPAKKLVAIQQQALSEAKKQSELLMDIGKAGNRFAAVEIF